MEKGEILAVLKIIRNTANFPYIQFIVPYDKEYIVTTIGEGDYGRDYLIKIFNLEITLPAYEEHIIVDTLRRELLNCCNTAKRVGLVNWLQNSPITISGIDSAHDGGNLLIPKVLKTRRDVIRFVNSFRLNVEMVEMQNSTDDIFITDLFVLELLRYHNEGIYKKLRVAPWEFLDVDDVGYKYPKQENKINVDSISDTLLSMMFKNRHEFTTWSRIYYLRNYLNNDSY